MQNIKIDIVGSCVTRDAFEFAKNIDNTKNYIINNYISKASVISLVSDPIEKETYKINDTKMTQWEFRQIKYDLEKNWIDILKNSDSDAIIVDFIDERYDLYKVENAYITKSNLFAKSKFRSNKKLEIIKRNSHECEALWDEYSGIYIDILKSLDKKIIVHKAMWKEYYLNNSPSKSLNTNFYIKNILYGLYYGNLTFFHKKIIPFRKKINRKIKINNKILEKYYKKLSEVDGFSKIEINKPYYADKGHKWGLAPFHYEIDYYKDFIKQLEIILE